MTRCQAALRRFVASGEPVTYAKVAARAGVSRAWLYTQPDVRAVIDRLRDVNNRTTGVSIPTRQRTSEVSLTRRLEAAHQRNQDLSRQVTDLREQLAAAHRALRTLRAEQPAQQQVAELRPHPRAGGHRG